MPLYLSAFSPCFPLSTPLSSKLVSSLRWAVAEEDESSYLLFFFFSKQVDSIHMLFSRFKRYVFEYFIACEFWLNKVIYLDRCVYFKIFIEIDSYIKLKVYNCF